MNMNVLLLIIVCVAVLVAGGAIIRVYTLSYELDVMMKAVCILIRKEQLRQFGISVREFERKRDEKPMPGRQPYFVQPAVREETEVEINTRPTR
jgi:hypothetical protein